MLIIVVAIVALIAGLIVHSMRVPHGVDPSPLGWMSEQWLAEHRNSHLP